MYNIHLPEENKPIGCWGRLYRDYLKEHHPICFNALCLSAMRFYISIYCLAELNRICFTSNLRRKCRNFVVNFSE
ncbi:MAG TPA: hypothetical protein DCM01_16060 [Dielma fastidiosa]|nr:hypothetical protein [Dielma fastidiosa]